MVKTIIKTTLVGRPGWPVGVPGVAGRERGERHWGPLPEPA